MSLLTERSPLWLSLLLLSIVGIGVVDSLTGPHLSMALFYAIPITLSGWFFGAWAALLTSSAAGLGLYFGDMALRSDAFSFPHIWNTTVRLAFIAAIGQLTARLRRDQHRLARLLAKETTARMETVEQLRHRDRLAIIGQVASGIAHEIGTPLNVIAGRARLITEPDTSLEEAREHARSVIEQSERVTSTIRQLLDFARRRGPELQEHDLGELAQRVVNLLRPLASKRDIELALARPGAPVPAAVDSMQLEQALSNLILNGLQAIREHGRVVVTVGSERPPASLFTGEQPRDMRFLRVEDNGAGIAPENLSHIFDPFFTTQRAGEGTGLGLSITQEIVKDHNGVITVDSQPGRGSRFTLFLPMPARQS